MIKSSTAVMQARETLARDMEGIGADPYLTNFVSDRMRSLAAEVDRLEQTERIDQSIQFAQAVRIAGGMSVAFALTAMVIILALKELGWI